LFASGLTWEGKTGQFAQVFAKGCRIKDDQVISFGSCWEVSVNSLGFVPAFFLRLSQHAQPAGVKFRLHFFPFLAFQPRAAPIHAVKGFQIQVGCHSLQRQITHHPGAPLSHLWDKCCRSDIRFLFSNGSWRFCSFLAKFLIGFFFYRSQQSFLAGRIRELVHYIQALEGIFTVVNAAPVVLSAFGPQDTPAKRRVNRCSANQHRDVHPTALQFIDDQRHLLAGGDQQCAQTDSAGLFFNCSRDDRLHWHLFAQVNYFVTVVCEDCPHQVLTNVVHVAKHGREHEFALGETFLLIQVIFKVGNSLFHNLRGLQNKGQDKISRTEAIANFFHRRQQNIVEDCHCNRTLRLISVLGENGIDIFLNASFVTAQDFLEQPLAVVQPFKWVCFGGLVILTGHNRVEISNEVRQGCVGAVEDQVFRQFAFIYRDFRIRLDLRGIENGHIEPSLNGMIEKDAVEYLA